MVQLQMEERLRKDRKGRGYYNEEGLADAIIEKAMHVSAEQKQLDVDDHEEELPRGVFEVERVVERRIKKV